MGMGFVVLSFLWYFAGAYFVKDEWPDYLYLLATGPMGLATYICGWAVGWISMHTEKGEQDDR